MILRPPLLLSLTTTLALMSVPAQAWACLNSMRTYHTSWTNVADWLWLAGALSLAGVGILRLCKAPTRYRLVWLLAAPAIVIVAVVLSSEAYFSSEHASGVGLFCFWILLSLSAYFAKLHDSEARRLAVMAITACVIVPGVYIGAGAVFDAMPPDLKITGGFGFHADEVVFEHGKPVDLKTKAEVEF